VDLYIADRNIARYHQGQDLDIAFLNILSADAVPAILPLWQESETGTQVNQWAGQWLSLQHIYLENEMTGTRQFAFSWNGSRRTAWDQLEAVRNQLPAYDSSLYWGSDYGFEREVRSDYQSGWDAVSTAAPGGE